jgi:hypothetical protein
MSLMQKGDEDEGSSLSVTEAIRIFEEKIQQYSQKRRERNVFLARMQTVWLNIPGKFYNNNEMPDRPTHC